MCPYQSPVTCSFRLQVLKGNISEARQTDAEWLPQLMMPDYYVYMYGRAVGLHHFCMCLLEVVTKCLMITFSAQTIQVKQNQPFKSSKHVKHLLFSASQMQDLDDFLCLTRVC